MEDKHREGLCYIGTDLAQTSDLCAVTRIFSLDRNRFAADFRCWIPEKSLENVPDAFKANYERAVNSEILKLTSGTVTDYDLIESYIRASCIDYDVERIGVDPHNATQLTNKLEDDGLPVMVVRQSITYMNAPSKLTEWLINKNWILHDGNPFITWQLENCYAYRDDANGNLKVRKGPDKNRKIDSIVAMIIAVSAADYGADPESGFTIRSVNAD